MVRLRSLLLVAVLGCAPGSRPLGTSSPPQRSPRGSPPATTSAASASEKPSPRAPKGSKRLSLAEARRYLVELINRDRATEGLAPVALDEGPPTAAGQRHAEDMAKRAFLGHWGTDGSTPEQRHTEAGGAHMVLENASCFTDEKPRTLDPDPRIDAADIERTEAMFFNEVPPNDGHRRNILRPMHRRVGVGIAQPVATATEIPVPCITEEFIDPYGDYDALPTRAQIGDMITVAGSVSSPAVFAGIGMARVDGPTALSVSEANRRRSYPIPTPYQHYWTAGYKTPVPVTVKHGRFSLTIPLSDHGRAGLYEVSIWAKLSESREMTMIGLRTLRVERAR